MHCGISLEPRALASEASVQKARVLNHENWDPFRRAIRKPCPSRELAIAVSAGAGSKLKKPRAAAPIVAFVGRTTRQNALEEVGRWSLVDGHYLTSASGARDFPADPVLRCPFEGVTTPAGCNDPAGVPHRWRQTLEKQRVTAGWDGPICLTGPVRPFIIEIVVSAQPFRSAEAAPFAAIAPVAPSPASCR